MVTRRLSVRTEVGAKRPGWYDLFWLFLISGWMGNYVEVLVVWAETGETTSRSSLLYGAISLVWGLGAILMTLVLAPMREVGGWRLFLAGAVLGGGVEYLASVATETMYGQVFWDYSHLPLNWDGRTNLLFAAFWGAGAVVWLRWLAPGLIEALRAIPTAWRRGLAVVAAVVLVLDIGVTAAALTRMRMRPGAPASGGLAVLLDSWYGDEMLRRRYRNMEDPGPDAGIPTSGT